MTFVIGLTGGIGSGKSSASKIFARLGIDVIDTDDIAHELTQPQGAAIAVIKKKFGNTFITPNGALERKKMRNLVFSDPVYRRQLEEILHPLIHKEAVRRIYLSQSPYTIIVIPLLFETMDYHTIIHRILVIDCDEQDQIRRTIARSQLNEQEVRDIMSTQISRQDRLNKADDIITNNQDIDYLKKQVIDLHYKYLAILKK